MSLFDAIRCDISLSAAAAGHTSFPEPFQASGFGSVAGFGAVKNAHEDRLSRLKERASNGNASLLHDPTHIIAAVQNGSVKGFPVLFPDNPSSKALISHAEQAGLNMRRVGTTVVIAKDGLEGLERGIESQARIVSNKDTSRERRAHAYSRLMYLLGFRRDDIAAFMLSASSLGPNALADILEAPGALNLPTSDLTALQEPICKKPRARPTATPSTRLTALPSSEAGTRVPRGQNTISVHPTALVRSIPVKKPEAPRDPFDFM